MNRHWYLVGQRSEARIFEQNGIKQELRLVQRFEKPEGQSKTSALVSDRQGRSDSSGMPGHNAVGKEDSVRQQITERFAHELAKFLEKENERKMFESLVIVAEPHFLGELRKAIGKETSKKLRQSVSKDLAHVADNEVALQLEGILCSREEIGA